MKEKNDYGMYSGAFIFDVLDRHALKYIKDQAGLAKKAVLVTKSSSISFQRQLCQKKYVVLCRGYSQIHLYDTLYFCTVDMYDTDHNFIAGANFTFTLATNHCEVK